VGFLSTRVKSPTKQDQSKLDRVLRYLNLTRSLPMNLRCDDGPLSISVFVDASYGVHDDMKSHSGGLITFGQGPVFVKSVKQKMNTKSSMEAEIVAVENVFPQALWLLEFCRGLGYEVGPAKLLQDNKSAIILHEKGYSSSEKSRHIAIKFFFVKDCIERGDAVVTYVSTENMIADVLTKPLQGQLFRLQRARLLGHSINDNFDKEETRTDG
jgi:hypothetical protein